MMKVTRIINGHVHEIDFDVAGGEVVVDVDPDLLADLESDGETERDLRAELLVAAEEGVA